jgi:DNA-binding CsgD family transcriptional regulator
MNESIDLLRCHFGLTPAEARLALHLVAGETLRSAEVKLSITYETGRTHLKNIFNKTGTCRQAELLVVILTALPGCVGAPIDRAPTPPVPASRYIHPEFGFFCPTPPLRRRLRVALACLVVAGVGAAVMATANGLKLAAAVTRADEASIAETTPATSVAPFATVVTRLPIVQARRPPRASRLASATPGPKATVVPSSCASRA